MQPWVNANGKHLLDVIMLNKFTLFTCQMFRRYNVYPGEFINNCFYTS